MLGGRAFWWTEALWIYAAGLDTTRVPLVEIVEFDMNCWFGDALPPTCRAVAMHAKRIYEAELTHPVILSAEGGLMDGGHRIAKAWLAGQDDVLAVRFEENPPPDWVVPDER